MSGAVARLRSRRARPRGQALAEFALALPVFALILVGVFDLGRGIYTYNGLSEAAREISRVTAVYPGLVLGASAQTTARVSVQQGLTPGMGTPTYACLQVDGTASTHNPCTSGDYVRVTVTSVYHPVTLLGLGGSITLTATSSSLIP
jgi:Flp pilus assembly protein TadG